MTHIAVLTGGSSAERLVALAGAVNVVDAFRSAGHEVVVVDTVEGQLSPAAEERLLVAEVAALAPDPQQLALWREQEIATAAVGLEAVRNAGLVFLVIHGQQGEGGELQGGLDAAGVPYTGTGRVGSSNAMDKNTAKQLFVSAGIPTPDWVMWHGSAADAAHLGMPLVVKPSRVGSSLGLTVVREPTDIQAAVDLALEYDEEVILESFLPGSEYTVGVLGNRALGVGEIIPQHDTFDYECKYTPGMTQEIFPARINRALSDELRGMALAAHRALGLRHFSRVDFKLASDGSPCCLEANTLPGLTGTSLLPQSAAVEGIGFQELCLKIRDLALADVSGTTDARRS